MTQEEENSLRCEVASWLKERRNCYKKLAGHASENSALSAALNKERTMNELLRDAVGETLLLLRHYAAKMKNSKSKTLSKAFVSRHFKDVAEVLENGGFEFSKKIRVYSRFLKKTPAAKPRRTQRPFLKFRKKQVDESAGTVML